MSLIWEDGPNGMQAKTDIGVYLMGDPDSTGRVQVDFQMDDMKVFVCIGFSRDEVEKKACAHHDWITAINTKP